MEEVLEIEQQVIACKEDVKCLNEMNNKIQRDIASLPRRIADVRDEILIAGITFTSKAEFCCKNNLDQFQAEGTKIYDTIVTCIKTKF